MGAIPQMRGFLVTKFKRDMVWTVALSICTVTAWRVCVVDKRKKAYADFYKNYDPYEDFERMRKKGVFKSVSAD